MITIYRVSHNQDATLVYPTPDPDAFANEVLGKLSELGESAVIPPFQKAEPDRKSAAFFNVSNKVLLFSKDVYLGELGKSLEYSGNVYPSSITDTSENVFFLNVTAMYNCLDIVNTTFYCENGEERGVDHGMGIKEPAFFPKLIGDSFIFRIPQMKSVIYVASNSSGSEEDFYSVYQSLEMKGLDFRKIWIEG